MRGGLSKELLVIDRNNSLHSQVHELFKVTVRKNFLILYIIRFCHHYLLLPVLVPFRFVVPLPEGKTVR